MKKKTPKSKRFTRPVSKLRIERIKEVLSETALMTKELAAATFMCEVQARAYIKHLHEKRRIYIKMWKRDVDDMHKRFRPFYAWGKEVDAEKPARLPEKERNRLRRMNPKNREKENAQQRAKRERLRKEREQANDNTMQVAA